MLPVVAVRVCEMCDGSHEDGATCPAYASKRRDEAPTATDAESLVIEMKSSPAAPMGPGSMLGQFKLIQEIGLRMRFILALSTSLRAGSYRLAPAKLPTFKAQNTPSTLATCSTANSAPISTKPCWRAMPEFALPNCSCFVQGAGLILVS